MSNTHTQQFAKFFLKDIKTKSPRYHTEKSSFNEVGFASPEKLLSKK